MASGKSVVALIKALKPAFRSSNDNDKVALAIHAYFLASGYDLTATGPHAFSPAPLNSSSTDEVGLEGWNELEDQYAFVYVNPEEGSKKVRVKCLVMEDKLHVFCALADGSSKHVELDVGNYVEETGGGNYSRQFKNMEVLVKILDSLNPLSSEISESHCETNIRTEPGPQTHLSGRKRKQLDALWEENKIPVNAANIASAGSVKEHSVKGTTCIMIILPNAIIMATDSRTTYYDEGIAGDAVKLQKISSQPPMMASICNDMGDSDHILKLVSSDAKFGNQTTYDDIIENASYYMEQNHSCFGFSIMFGCIEDGIPKAFFLDHAVHIKHYVGCKEKAKEKPCWDCPRDPIFTDKEMSQGVFGMGSGHKPAIAHLGSLYEKMYYKDGRTGNHQLVEDPIAVELVQAKEDALEALFIAALNDPYSGPPFRVAEITSEGTGTPQIYSFTDAYKKFGALALSGLEDKALFLVYPADLDRKDNGNIILEDDSLIARKSVSNWGHALAYLHGHFYLRIVTFTGKGELEKVFKSRRLQMVEESPRFYDSDDCKDLRFYDAAVHTMKGTKRLKVARKLYLSRITTDFVYNLIEYSDY